MALGNTVKYGSHLKYYAPFPKDFCVFILIINILFCRKNQKQVLQEEIKDWTFKTYLFTEETSSWFPLIESLKMA